MMGKHQVDSAGVYVESRAEILHRHGGAFNVPAGPSIAERSIPGRLSIFFRFPEHEIPGVRLFVFIGVDAGSGTDPAEIVVRQLAIAWKAGNAEVSGTFARVGTALFGEILDGAHHLRYVFG